MFITLEGIDGCGKTTQARLLCRNMEALGKTCLLTREPGDWSEGALMREILLKGSIEHPLTEVLLFLADRCEHMSQVIEPALARGEVVLSDRYNDSTLAYQCWGRGVSRYDVERLFGVCGLRVPDATLWFDLSPEEALRRRGLRGSGDRIENAEAAFHRRVAEGFKALAAEFPRRFIRIDATPSVEAVALCVMQELSERGLL